MECPLTTTVYAFSLMSDIDPEDFRYGQLFTVAIALAFVVVARALLAVST